VAAVHEPSVNATIVVPNEYLGRVMELCSLRRGAPLEHTDLGSGRTLLRYELPLAELASDFYSRLKSATQGYASFDYGARRLLPAAGAPPAGRRRPRSS